MNKQYKVINRENRREYTLNAEQLSNFFKHQLMSDYAISILPSKKESFLLNLALACFSLAFIVTATKIIMRWI